MRRYFEKIKPKDYKWIAFALTVITYLVAFSYLELLSNGKYIIARSDLLQQYIPFIGMLEEALRGEKSFWFSWNINMGGSTALLNAYYTLSPFNILFLLFGKNHIMEACALVIVLKAGLSAFTFQIFIRRVLKQEGIRTVLFAMMYALCGFQVAYHFILSWMDALYLFPVVILLIVRLVREGKWLGLSFAYAYLFFTSFYMGYIAGMSSFFLFAAYAVYHYGRAKPAVYLKAFFKLMGSVLLAAGLTCIIWYPALLELLNNLSDYAGDFETTYCNPLFIYNNLFVGQMQTLQGLAPFIYCGIPSMLLLPCYFLNGRIRRREKICFGVLLLWFGACVLFLPLNRMMHAFDDPNMLRYRYAYCFSFLLAVIGCRQSLYIKSIPGRTILATAVCYGILYIAAAALYKNTYVNDYNSNTAIGFFVNFFFILCWILAVLWYRRGRADYITFFTLAALLVMTELGVNAGMSMKRMEHEPPLEDVYTSWYGVTENAVEEIKKMDEGWYRINAYHTINKNTGVWFDFQSLTNFTSAANRALMHTMKDLGFYVDDVVLCHAGGTPVTELLLGIKYEMDMAKDLAYIKDSNSSKAALHWEQREKYLSLGYMVGEEILEYQPETSPFMNQNKLLTAMTGEKINCFEKADSVSLKMENGRFRQEEGMNYLETAEKEGESGEDKEPIFHFTLPPRQNREVFAYFRQPQRKYQDSFTELKTNDTRNENITVDLQLYPERILKLGEYEREYRLDISLKENTDSVPFIDSYFTYYNAEELQRAFDILKNNQLSDVVLTKRGAKGQVETEEDKSILFTSIPYSEGLKALVDGREADILPLINRTFIGVRLEPGIHKVEFLYEPPGLREGAAVTILAAGIILYMLVKYLRIWEGIPLSNKN